MRNRGDDRPAAQVKERNGEDQLSSLSLVLPVRTLVDLAPELKGRLSSLRLRLRSVSRVFSRTPHRASCFFPPQNSTTHV